MEHGWTLEGHRFRRFKVEEMWRCIDGQVCVTCFFGPALRVPTCEATKSSYLQSHVLHAAVEPNHGASSAGCGREAAAV